MPAPSYTYSLTNGSTADASQVMQNYNDILNGVTDGSKDLTINALTANGAVSFKGTVALGDASADDITVTGSLASTIPIKTTNTYDLGSATKGMAGLYLGTGSTQTARIVCTGTLASSRTYTLLDAGAAANFVLSEGTAIINGTKTFGGQLIGKGTATNDTAAAGYIGEYMEAVDSGGTALTSGTISDVSSVTITLTAGCWDISADVQYVPAATTTTTLVQAWIGTLNGNTATGRDTVRNFIAMAFPTGTVLGNQTNCWSLPTWRVTLSGSQQYWLKVSPTFGTSTATANGGLRATRVR